MMRDHDGTILIPLLAEEASAAKQQKVTGRVRVSTISRQHEQEVNQMLVSESVDIERVPRGQVVDRVPPIREEGDTVIIPVVEEVTAVERRLILKEEVRVRRVRTIQQYQERVQLRKQELVISRVPEAEEAAAPEERPEPNSTTSRKEK